jgi:hypothetical protein
MDEVISGNLMRLDRDGLIETFFFICNFEQTTFGYKESESSYYYVEIYHFSEIDYIKLSEFKKSYNKSIIKIFEYKIHVNDKEMVLNTADGEENIKWTKCFNKLLKVKENDQVGGVKFDESEAESVEENDVEEIKFVKPRTFTQNNVIHRVSEEPILKRPHQVVVDKNEELKAPIKFDDEKISFDENIGYPKPPIKNIKKINFKDNEVIHIDISEETERTEQQSDDVRNLSNDENILLLPEELKQGDLSHYLNTSKQQSVVDEGDEEIKRNKLNDLINKRKLNQEYFITKEFANWNYYDKDMNVIQAEKIPYLKKNKKFMVENLLLHPKVLAPKTTKKPIIEQRKNIENNFITVKYKDEDQGRGSPAQWYDKIEKFLENRNEEISSGLVAGRKDNVIENDNYKSDYNTYITNNCEDDIYESAEDDNNSYSSLRSNSYRKILAKKFKHVNKDYSRGSFCSYYEEDTPDFSLIYGADNIRPKTENTSMFHEPDSSMFLSQLVDTHSKPSVVRSTKKTVNYDITSTMPNTTVDFSKNDNSSPFMQPPSNFIEPTQCEHNNPKKLNLFSNLSKGLENADYQKRVFNNTDSSLKNSQRAKVNNITHDDTLLSEWIL